MLTTTRVAEPLPQAGHIGGPVHTITFYPVGNGDTSQIVLSNGRRILFDYRHLAASEGGDVPEINLKERLRKELKDAGRDYLVLHGIPGKADLILRKK